MKTTVTQKRKPSHIATALIAGTLLGLSSGNLNAQLYSYDFNAGAMGWTTEIAGNTCLGLSTASSHWALDPWGMGGTQSYGNPSIGNLGAENSYIISPTLTLPASISISFDSYSNNESGYPCSYDVEFVEYSTDGGATWNSFFATYQTNLHDYGMATWHNLTFTATITPTDNGRIRFRYDTGDGCCGPAGTTGWYVDNINIAEGGGGGGGTGTAWYVYSNTTGGEPWFTTTNTTAMNTAFGPEGTGWTRGYFETLDVAAVFSPDVCFVFLEGGDSHAIELENFLIANMSTIENWVEMGGHLFLNAAPNEGDGMSYGFGGVTLTYPYYTSNAQAVDAAHPIFNGPNLPVGTLWTGTSFGHATVSGGDVTGLIQDQFAPGTWVAAEKTWGSGDVIFGGMTTNNFHSPLTEAANLRANILAYLSCDAPAVCPVPTGLYADGITTNDAVLHWDSVAGADQYRVTLQNTVTGLVKKKGYTTNYVEIIDHLDPLTTYAFRVKTVCYDDLGEISAPSDWYYFTTLGRIGEADASVTLFPNPNNGQFTLELNNLEASDFTIHVFDAVGHMVYSKVINVSSNNYSEQISLDVPAGIYQVNVSNEKHQMNYPIVIQH